MTYSKKNIPFSTHEKWAIAIFIVAIVTDVATVVFFF